MSKLPLSTSPAHVIPSDVANKPYHHGNLRNTLLAAAREALRTQSPEELSLRQLARDAGVSANAPYRHFADRDVLLTALAIDGYRSLTAAIREQTLATSPSKRLAALADGYLAFATAEPGLFRLMFRPLSTAERSAELVEGIHGFFAEIVSAADAVHSDHDPEQSLRRSVGIWVTLHGSTMLALDGTLDWLDAWLRPSGSELVTALRAGFPHHRHDRGGS